MTGTHAIPALSLWRRSMGLSLVHPRVLAGVLLLNLIFQLGNYSIWGDFGRRSIVVLIGIVAAGIGLVVIVGRVRYPPPVVDFDRSEIRIGSESTAFADVTEAAVIRIARRHRDDLFLWFGGHKRRHTTVALRAGKNALSESDRAVLAAMVERSSIQLPTPKADLYDPKGKFAWLDQQGYATKDQVVEALLHTPATGDIKRF